MLFSMVFAALFAGKTSAQKFEKEFAVAKNQQIEIVNLFGRVNVSVDEKSEKAILKFQSGKESSVLAAHKGSRLQIEVNSTDSRSRIDLDLIVPARIRLKIETSDGEVRIGGNFESVEIKTGTGTIAADVPVEDVRYNFVWTASRPRFLSDVSLADVKEKAAGKFVIKGKILKGRNAGKSSSDSIADDEEVEEPVSEASETLDKNSKLDFSTARGIILFNVDPTAVPSDLGEKPLTNAAKAIIRSGDSILMEAIRRASPKYFGDYAKTLPPAKMAPVLESKSASSNVPTSKIKKVLVQVTDVNNRSIPDLKPEDFVLTERGSERQILSVEPATTSFNLVLLVDVSGSVDNYVNFIRKAARNFVNTVNPNDKVAIIIFNQDVEILSNFTTDKVKLSESLDTFDAGGGTAYYDALAYTLAETLRPLKGDRTGIVVLTDGEDTRSFLPFDSIIGAVEESGALIYPLYVPNGLIASARNQDPNSTVDPLRARYFGLSSKADAEGERLAKVSGGVYYPIRQLDELQKAYDDIVLQLRTAYSITYRSDLAIRNGAVSPFLKVRVKRENSFVKLGSVVEVPDAEEPETPKDTTDKNVPDQASGLIRIDAGETTSPFVDGISRRYASDSTVASDVSYRKAVFGNANSAVEISGEVENIKYNQSLADDLRTYKFENFDINTAAGAFLLASGSEKVAVSRWISPKRTRSYPYERVYDTLSFSGKKVAVIPVVKDEGLGGDRDFLQWDTISLLSLLDVHVVLAFYDDAEKNTKKADKITSQKFDKNFVLNRLSEIFEFAGTAREWNEKEAKQLKSVFEKAKSAYREISEKTKTYLHDETALDELIKASETPQLFIEFSRSKAKKAQGRESETLQPKEALASDTKGRITIRNALFGKYFFTVDETRIDSDEVFLIEAKHSQRAKIPGKNDIKDGLIKMMLYTNLKNVKLGSKPVKSQVQIRLTSAKLSGSIASDESSEKFNSFCSDNLIDPKQKSFLAKLFSEARENNFTVILEHGSTAK